MASTPPKGNLAMSFWKTMWRFHTLNFSVVWQIAPDSDYDLSWDETGEVKEKLERGIYQCFQSRIIVCYQGDIIADDYLGCSIYENPAEFRDHIGSRGKYGSYFTDMVRTAISDARQKLHKIQALHIRKA
jgi:hypothetical protein